MAKSTPTIFVKAKGSGRVPYYHAPLGARRFVGRTYDADLNDWIADEKEVEVPDTREFRRHIAEGDLELVDVSTSKEVA